VAEAEIAEIKEIGVEIEADVDKEDKEIAADKVDKEDKWMDSRISQIDGISPKLYVINAAKSVTIDAIVQ